MNAIITEIQKFSLHDGPGIRTTVFFKGCNMSCPWCHNPETISIKPELIFYSSKCINCGWCYRVCTHGALTKEPKRPRVFKKELCAVCGDCTEACAPAALKIVGKSMSIDEIMDTVLADKDYYDASNGGVTLSGGEILMQADAAAELLARCKEAGISTAIESNLSFPFATVKKLLPYIDRVYCDIKLIDDEQHKKYTGVSNKNTLNNVAEISGMDIPVVVRTPLIPGITDSEENIYAIALWIKNNTEAEAYELLNYNPLAEEKNAELGKDYSLGKLRRKTREEMERLYAVIESAGVHCLKGAD